MRRLKIRLFAQQDVQEIVDYYDAINPEISNRFLEKLFSELEIIKQNPEIFAKKYQEIRSSHLQKFPFNIYYTLHDESVEVLAVLHTSRNPEIWKKR